MARDPYIVALPSVRAAMPPFRQRLARHVLSGRSEILGIAPKLAGTLGASGVIALLGAVSGTTAARALGPAGRGELAQILLWPQIIATLGILGLDLAAIHLSADPARRKNAPATVLLLAAAEGALLIPVYLVLLPFLFSGSERTSALLTLPIIHGLIIGSCAAACLSGRLQFRLFNATRVAAPLLYCAAIVALWLSGLLTPRSGALAFVLAAGIADALALLFIWRSFGFGSFERPLARRAVSYGVRSHIGRVTPQLLSVDAMIVALLLPTRDVGIFVVATSFLAAPTLLTSAVGLVMFPHVSTSHLAGERARFRATFFAQLGAVTAVALLLVAFAHPAIVTLFGSDYASGAEVLRLLAVASVALSARSFLIEVLRGLGRPGLTSLAEIVNWALFLVAAITGALAGGLVGTALAVTVASFASLGVLGALAWVTRAFQAAPAPDRRALAEAT
ncbi:MAG TPA: hypothetical protein VEZ14_08170 [Dehalococcoidia bacterium]|nr:hypothetical protein [Dehalococcoidia bacterium]